MRKNIIEPYDSIFREISHEKVYLEKANELKMNLFSIIAHDLTSSAMGVAGLSETLDVDFNELAVETQKEYVSELRHSSKSLMDLVENLLVWSRLELKGNLLIREKK